MTEDPNGHKGATDNLEEMRNQLTVTEEQKKKGRKKRKRKQAKKDSDEMTDI